MQVVTDDRDGRVRRDGIDPLARRQLAAPTVRVPVSALEPLPLGQGRRRRSDPPYELLTRIGVPQRRPRQHERGTGEMRMAVVHPGNDERTLQIDNTCGLARARANLRRAQRGDTVPDRPDRVGAILRTAPGPGPGIHIGDVQRGRCRACARCQESGSSAHELATVYHNRFAYLPGFGLSARHLSSFASHCAALSGP